MAVQPERVQKMRPYQRINHHPGMYELSRKKNLARNLMKMQKFFQDESPALRYDFFPKTYLLPSELHDFQQNFQNGRSKNIYILKPDNGS